VYVIAVQMLVWFGKRRNQLPDGEPVLAEINSHCLNGFIISYFVETSKNEAEAVTLFLWLSGIFHGIVPKIKTLECM